MIIGGHYFGVFNISDFRKVLEHVKKTGGNACQIFVGNDSKTTLKYKAHFSDADFREAKKLLREYGITLVIHGNLTMNFGNPMSSGRYHWMLDNIAYDMQFAEKIGAVGCVIHTGFQTHTKNEREAIDNMANNIELLFKSVSSGKTKVIIETSAGQKNRIATSIEELALLYHKIDKKFRDRIRFCIDSCHIFSAGYAINTIEGIREYFEKFDDEIGEDKIVMIHLNDSKTELDSRVNRHENLMEGNIFKSKEILREFLKFVRNKIIILETRKLSKYKSEIRLVKSL